MLGSLLFTKKLTMEKEISTLAKINRAKEEVAREIADKIHELFEGLENHEDVEDFYMNILKYIDAEHLFKSDYTQ